MVETFFPDPDKITRYYHQKVRGCSTLRPQWLIWIILFFCDVEEWFDQMMTHFVIFTQPNKSTLVWHSGNGKELAPLQTSSWPGCGLRIVESWHFWIIPLRLRVPTAPFQTVTLCTKPVCSTKHVELQRIFSVRFSKCRSFAPVRSFLKEFAQIFIFFITIKVRNNLNGPFRLLLVINNEKFG